MQQLKGMYGEEASRAQPQWPEYASDYLHGRTQPPLANATKCTCWVLPASHSHVQLQEEEQLQGWTDEFMANIIIVVIIIKECQLLRA